MEKIIWYNTHKKIRKYTLNSVCIFLICLNIDRGVGSGIIVNGKLRYGAQDIASEVGHMTISVNGENSVV